MRFLCARLQSSRGLHAPLSFGTGAEKTGWSPCRGTGFLKRKYPLAIPSCGTHFPRSTKLVTSTSVHAVRHKSSDESHFFRGGDDSGLRSGSTVARQTSVMRDKTRPSGRGYTAEKGTAGRRCPLRSRLSPAYRRDVPPHHPKPAALGPGAGCSKLGRCTAAVLVEGAGENVALDRRRVTRRRVPARWREEAAVDIQRRRLVNSR